MANLGKPHWQAIKRLFRYIQGTKDYYMQFIKTKNLQPLIGYSDGDWGGKHPNTRKSTSRFCFILSGGAIS